MATTATVCNNLVVTPLHLRLLVLTGVLLPFAILFVWLLWISRSPRGRALGEARRLIAVVRSGGDLLAAIPDASALGLALAAVGLTEREPEELDDPPEAEVRRLHAASADLARRAMAMEPEDGSVGLEAARAFVAVDRLDEARRIVAVHARSPADLPFEVLAGLGRVAAEIDDPDGAAALFQRALALAPRDFEAMKGLAEALLELDRPAEALPVIERAISEIGLQDRADPTYHNRHANLVYELLDLRAEAARAAAGN